MTLRSADKDAVGPEELVVGHWEVAGCGSAADAPGGVVVRAVARAVVAAEVAEVWQRDAAEMRANADDHQPARVLHAVRVVRRVLESAHRRALLCRDFSRRAVPHEQWLSAPFHCDLTACKQKTFQTHF